MIKRINVLIFFISFFIFPFSTFAETYNYGYFGTNSETDTVVIADGKSGATAHGNWYTVKAGGGNGFIVWYGAGTNNVIGTSPIPGTGSAPSGSLAFGLRSSDGSEVYAIEGTSDNPTYGHVLFCGSSSSCSEGSGGSEGSEGGGGCDSCEVFSCPGWSQYMGKLDGIKAAIPPAPNWEKVADTFRDSIAPRIKADLREVLGRVSNPPATPKVPKAEKVGKPIAPPQPGGLDDRGIKAPTGKEIPNVGGFDKDKIKNEAEVIKERKDPTGGFEILNPIDKMPSQDEFKGLKPKPEEGKSPEPDEGKAALPKPPKEEENKAPAPKENENKAPTPSQGENKAPTPNEGGYKAPIPGNQDNKAPTPSQGDNKAPTPSQGGYYGPTPSQGDNKAPIPKGGG